MNILVLGSSGQVGAYLVRYLISLGHDVIEFDIVRSKNEDLRFNNKKLNKLVDKSDFIFFLAFDVGGSRYLSKYQHTYDFINNNIKIMDTTFSAIKKYNKPFVFASSQMSNMSYSPYGIAKAVGECYTRSLGGAIVKFWNVYGLEHDFEKSHVITDFIIKAKNTGIIDMLTDGSEEREFLYAEDCCEALVAVMENYKNISREEDLCITSFKSNTILEIAEIVSKNINSQIMPGQNKDTVQLDKKNVPSQYILNFWQPKISINEGIYKIIKEMYFE
jgi:nucleoside-diphosphate-sugar epimerase